MTLRKLDLLGIFRLMIMVMWVCLGLGCGDDGMQNPPLDQQDSGPDGGDGGDGGADTEPKPDLKVCPGEVDVCPESYTGLTWDCQNRFVYGINYAWRRFGGDFGGAAAWDTLGVAGNRQTYVDDLTAMRDVGANVIRWWMFPDFSGDAVAFDGNERPIGIGGTVEADILAALEIAEELDIYYMLTLFSFDNFEPTWSDDSGTRSESLQPIAVDDAKRAALMEKAIRPIVRIVEGSPYRHRVMSWDLINEPEWAMEGRSLYDDPRFDPNYQQIEEPLTHEEMETFLADIIAVLREESSAMITVGASAFKWKNAWIGLDLDFYQFHMYEWIHQGYPLTTPAAQWELDKPIVMGEYFITYLDREDPETLSYHEMTESFYATGYAGALGWQFIDTWYRREPLNLDNLTPFATAHPCETRYSHAGR